MASYPLPQSVPPWRQAVAKEALSWVGKVGGINPVGPGQWELHGWQTLIQIYKEAGETSTSIIRSWTPEMERGIRQGYWVRKVWAPGKTFTSVEEEGVAWCGIFAVWVLKRCGYKVHWGGDRKIHMQPGDLELKAVGAGRGWQDQIQTGDICALGGNQHHVLIIDPLPGKPNVVTVEGNIPSPKRHAIELRTNRIKAEFHTWYQLGDL